MYDYHFLYFYFIFTDMQTDELPCNGHNLWVGLINIKCLGREDGWFIKQFIYLIFFFVFWKLTFCKFKFASVPQNKKFEDIVSELLIL